MRWPEELVRRVGGGRALWLRGGAGELDEDRREAEPRLYPATPRVCGGALQLRGGLWYSRGESDEEGDEEDEEDEESSQYDDESDEEEEDQAEAARTAMGAGWPDEGVEGELRRATEGLNDQEVNAHPALIPVRMQGESLRDFVASHEPMLDAEIRMPQYSAVYAEGRSLEQDEWYPACVEEIYGFGEFLLPLNDTTWDDPTIFDQPRSILAVPLEDLPPYFHWPSGVQPLDPILPPTTLATRFSKWRGPAPDSVTAKLVSPLGLVWAYSFRKELEWTEEDMEEELGGREAAGFFRRVTEQRVAKGHIHQGLDGTFEPGPLAIGADVFCANAEGVGGAEELAAGLADGRAIRVPEDHEFVFRAVEACTSGDRVVCGAGTRFWGSSSEEYPKWAIDVATEQGEHRLFRLQGAGRNDSILQGQWRFSNASYGAFSHVSLSFTTLLLQPLVQVFSGPWLFSDCDFRCPNGVCLQVWASAIVEVRECALGGTAPECHPNDIDLPSCARFAIDVGRDAQVTAVDCVLEDVGWHGGAAILACDCSSMNISRSTIRRARVALQIVHFAHVKVQDCILEESEYGAFWCETYRTLPEACLPEFEALVEAEEWEDKGDGTLESNMRWHPSAQGSWPDPHGEVQQGRLEVVDCNVAGQAWLDEKRPLDLHVSPPHLAAQLR